MRTLLRVQIFEENMSDCRQMAVFATPPARQALSSSRQRLGSSLGIEPYRIRTDLTLWVL